MGRRVTRVDLEANVSGVVRGFRTAGSEADAAHRKVSSLELELEKLSKSRYEPSVILQDRDAQQRLRDVTAKLDALARKTADARVNVNDADALTGISRVESGLLTLGQKTADPNIDLKGIADAEARLGVLEAQLSRFDHSDYVAEVHVDGTARASRSASFLIDTITMLGPAAVSASGVAGGAILGLGSAFGTALAPAGLLTFAITEQVKSMKEQEKQIQTDVTKLAGLTQGTAEYQAQLAKVRAEQKSFNDQFGVAADAIDRAKHMMAGFLSDVGQGGLNQLIADAVGLASKFLPAIEGIVTSSAGAVDKLIADLARFGQSQDAKALVAFFETNGPNAIQAFGAVAGNLGKGLMSLFMAFLPLQNDMLGGSQKITAEFARWAAEVGRTDGFKAFIEYVETEGPKVWDTLGSLAQAFIAIAQAAAPVGSATLPVIKSLADILAMIAKSPAGPVLVSAAVGFTTLNRALTTIDALKASRAATAITGIGDSAKVAGAKSLAAKGGFIAAGVGLEILASHVDDSHSTLKGFLDVAGGAAIGAAFGPWGAVIGGAGGLLQALSEHSQAAAAQQKMLEANAQGVADSMDQQTGALTRNTAATLRKQLADTGALEAAGRLGISYHTLYLATEGNVPAQGRMQAAIEKVLAPLEAQSAGFRDISSGLHAATPEYDRWKAALDSARSDASLLTGTVDENSKAIETNRQRIAEQQQLITRGYILTGRAAGQYGAATQTARQMGGAVVDVNGNLVTLTGSTLAAASATRQLTDAQRKAAGFLSHQEAWTSFKSAVLDAADALKQNGAGLNANTREGVANRQALESVASQAQAYASTLRGVAKIQWEKSEVAKLTAIAHGFGMPIHAAQEWARHVLGLPTHSDLKVNVDDDDANRKLDDTKGKADDLGKTEPVVKVSTDTSAAIDSLNRFRDTADGILDGIKDEPVNVTLTAQASKVLGQLNLPELPAKADGGPVFGPGGPRSDSILARLSNNEHVITASEIGKLGHGDSTLGHLKMKAIRRMILRGEFDRAGDLQPFADGGPVLNPVVRSSGLGAAAGQVQGIFDRVAGTLAAILSSRATDYLTHLPQQGQLGPGGALTPAQIVRGQDAARSQVGKPYIWGGVGPDGYDCSGFQSYVLNSAMGFGNPYYRRGSTASMPWPGSHPGLGKYTIGWTTNFGGSGIGHTAGNIGGLNVESYGGHGPAVGSGARGPMDPHFYGHMYYDQGGVMPAKSWGIWHNNLPHDETVISAPPAQVAQSMGHVVVQSDPAILHRLTAIESALLNGRARVNVDNANEVATGVRSTVYAGINGNNQAQYNSARSK